MPGITVEYYKSRESKMSDFICNTVNEEKLS